MSIAALITEGFGTFGDVGHVVLDGFQSGQQTVIATILTEAFGTLTGRSPYLVTEGFGSQSTPPPGPPFGRSGLGGDDVPRRNPNRGWDREEWLRRRRKETEMVETIQQTYASIMGTAPVIVKEAATEVIAYFATEATEVKAPELRIDWAKMAADYENVRRLTALWQEEQERIDDEETWILLQ